MLIKPYMIREINWIFSSPYTLIYTQQPPQRPTPMEPLSYTYYIYIIY
jgi:hypothetical protein